MTALEERKGSVVGARTPDESAPMHVTGTASYVDDLRDPEGTVHGVLVLSPVAHGRLDGIDTAAAVEDLDVICVVTAGDIPGANNFAPRLGEDPLLAFDELCYVGQPIAVVVARTRYAAERAAARVALRIAPLPFELHAAAAHAQADYVVPPVRLAAPSEEAVDTALAGSTHRFSGAVDIGGQEHFYLEPQVALAMRTDDGACVVRSSTQHPTEVQHVVAHALRVAAHRVRVECRRMGGAFGGKESFSAQIGALAAIAATVSGRPVKIRLDRHDDDLVTGKRHPFSAEWSAGVDDHGRILGYRVSLLSNGGHSADMSAPVMARAICHIDSAYYLPAVVVDGFTARTNRQSNTAFRGFGGPQGALTTEIAVDSIARRLGLDPLDVRLANIYGAASAAGEGVDALRTPYGMLLEDNVLPELLARLVESSDYRARRASVAAFNAGSDVIKRGLALTPVKFGIGFNLTHLNQAGALVHVYVDGSVLVNHAATEMGQGVNTKVAQVVAEELGVPLAMVRSTATDTDKVANTSATAASTGSDLNGMAALEASRRIRERLVPVAARLLNAPPDSVMFREGLVEAGERAIPFREVVDAAYRQRVQLWSEGFYATPGLSWDPSTLTGHPFFYFCYGASVSEVVVDTLTGEHRVVRTDILHDVGRSLNPTIDIGQIEGGFVQGMGWLTTEELHWNEATGVLETMAPTTYKVPAVHDVPMDFRVELFDNASTAETIHRSKAVGEPPVLLAFSVFLAIRDAVAACGGPHADPPLRSPATAEAILRAIHAVRGVD